MAQQRGRSAVELCARSIRRFVTIDRNLEHQQNLKKFNLGFIVVRAPSNEIISYRPIFVPLQEAAEVVRAGQVIYVVSPQART